MDWRSGAETAHLVEDDAGSSRMCGLKPQVGVDAAVSSPEGILCAAYLDWMILHDAAVMPRERSPSNEKFSGERYEIRAEAETDLACTLILIGCLKVEVATTRECEHQPRFPISEKMPSALIRRVRQETALPPS